MLMGGESVEVLLEDIVKFDDRYEYIMIYRHEESLTSRHVALGAQYTLKAKNGNTPGWIDDDAQMAEQLLKSDWKSFFYVYFCLTNVNYTYQIVFFAFFANNCIKFTLALTKSRESNYCCLRGWAESMSKLAPLFLINIDTAAISKRQRLGLTED
ncbi:8330_t:CDS:2, partial [Ambispora leptoticha]